jgi:hypothetical protein
LLEDTPFNKIFISDFQEERSTVKYSFCPAPFFFLAPGSSPLLAAQVEQAAGAGPAATQDKHAVGAGTATDRQHR